MSEFNENRSYDTQYGMPNKEKKSHPVLLVLLCTVLSLLSGALGGWFAMTRFGSGSTVVGAFADEAAARAAADAIPGAILTRTLASQSTGIFA